MNTYDSLSLLRALEVCLGTAKRFATHQPSDLRNITLNLEPEDPHISTHLEILPPPPWDGSGEYGGGANVMSAFRLVGETSTLADDDLTAVSMTLKDAATLREQLLAFGKRALRFELVDESRLMVKAEADEEEVMTLCTPVMLNVERSICGPARKPSHIYSFTFGRPFIDGLKRATAFAVQDTGRPGLRSVNVSVKLDHSPKNTTITATDTRRLYREMATCVIHDPEGTFAQPGDVETVSFTLPIDAVASLCRFYVRDNITLKVIAGDEVPGYEIIVQDDFTLWDIYGCWSRAIPTETCPDPRLWRWPDLTGLLLPENYPLETRFDSISDLRLALSRCMAATPIVQFLPDEGDLDLLGEWEKQYVNVPVKATTPLELSFALNGDFLMEYLSCFVGLKVDAGLTIHSQDEPMAPRWIRALCGIDADYILMPVDLEVFHADPAEEVPEGEEAPKLQMELDVEVEAPVDPEAARTEVVAEVTTKEKSKRARKATKQAEVTAE